MTFNSNDDILIMFSEFVQGEIEMEKSELADLTIMMMGLLIEMFRLNLIPIDSFVKTTHIKVDFLERFIEGSVAEDMVERVRRILSQYHSCLLNAYSSVCNTLLSEDQFSC